MIQDPDTIQIREAVKGDAEKIAEIERMSWLETYPNKDYGIEEEDIKQKFDTALDRIETIQEIIGYQDHKYFVAGAGDKIAGYFHGLKGLNENQVVEAYVLPEYQRQNIGRKGIEALLSWFGSERSVFVEIASYNLKSINFFKSLGFAEAEGARRKETWNILPSGNIIPLTFMRKTFRVPQDE
ncbi:GNAT family N-acetyltransferase [candidate division WWE3 bacterium]|jgi:GNAT superfamily N-acetyltransferase|uniref:GNAT family N-acetyltransferase n=1 Tax=candidate division WWE3 bacterium TaxID=2053526 RepID=A0A3A4ZC20_UNCKA|nr:MAG: GNAT family N-acetyltransferase [candidate division WWE3 bacterium]